MKPSAEEKQDKEVFRKIFIDHWEEFKREHPSYKDAQYEEPVQKMLSCGKESGGYSEYICTSCGRDIRRVCFSCKSCFCLSCAKVYVDSFVDQISQSLHTGVVYRHTVLTVPEQLREYFYRVRYDGRLLSELMRCGYECLEDVVSTVKRRSLKIGANIVVQTHGRSGHYNPHLHVIMTDGGIDEERGTWVDLGYFPYEVMHKKWQYHLFRLVKSYFGTVEIRSLIDQLWKKYPDGLVAYVTPGTVPERYSGLARYLAKYVASPPIAIRRILDYDGTSVTYWYKDHTTKSKLVEKVSVFTFIGRMVQHIFPKGFHRVRFFGVQAPRTFKKWSEVVMEGLQRLGRQIKHTYKVIGYKSYRERYKEVNGHDPMICRYCGKEMELWKIWHPKYGVIYDESEKLKANEYGSLFKEEGRRGHSVRSSAGAIQLSMFPLRV